MLKNIIFICHSKAWFKNQTIHELNLHAVKYIELSNFKFNFLVSESYWGHLFQFGTAQAFLILAKPVQEFKLWSNFGMALIQMPNFSCANPQMHKYLL